MIQLSGSLWGYTADYKCVTTNGIVSRGCLIMGAGVALQAKQRFPDLPKKLGVWVRKYGNRPFICPEEKLITFPTKHSWRDDSDLDLIVDSARKIVQITDKYSLDKVFMTRPGCGNGGLNWINVSAAISGVFDDRFVVLELNGN